MITENDIKALTRHETRLGKIANWAVVVAPICLVLASILNLHLASRIGSNVGFDLIQLFQSWIEGIDLNKQYSGIVLKSMERLTTALLQIGFAVVLSILAYAYHKRRKMDVRILETLKCCGALKV